MHRLGDRDDVALEQPAGVRVGQHDRGDVRAERLAHVLGMRPCRRPAPGSASTVKPISAAVAGLVPCAESGTSTTLRVAPSPARGDGGLDRHHAAELAMRAGLRASCATAGMPVERLQLVRPARSISVERARHGGDRLQRMDVGEARQPRHLLVEARIVLHRAGAEREEAGVDAVVLLRTGARSGASSRARRGRAGRSASLRSSPPRRGAKSPGSSRSTPVVSARPISKSSGSSIMQARGCR